MQSIKNIFKITTVDELNAAREQFEQELDIKLQPLVIKLDQNILSQDVSSIEQHMAFVESWRATLVQYYSLASAFTDHAKDSTFLPAKTDGEGTKRTPEIERDAFRRKLSGGFTALQLRLEGYIDCIDSRVNLSKKVLGIEVEAPHKRTV
jgi:hypothetical protein